MAASLYTKNLRPFMATVNGEFGRRKLTTREDHIGADNIVNDLANQSVDFLFNQQAIMYLDRYYRGDQPILYRAKNVRKEINNKVMENHAFEIVESQVADLCGEPVQYALKGEENEEKSKAIMLLNRFMESEDKASLDIERERWARICGTSYFYVGKANRMSNQFDEAPFYIRVKNPAYTSVVYFEDDDTPAYSFQQLKDANDLEYYMIFTTSEWFKIQNGKIVDSGVNGNYMIPVIEYPANERRLSSIELTITLTDEMNKMQSDRMNGIEGFTQALMLFKNCEIDENTFLKMCALGAVSVKTTTQGYDADVKQLTEQLDQSQSQTAKDDVYQNILLVQGKPGRQEAAGSDTGQAVVLRNGYYDEYKRAELRIPTFLRCERMMLRVVLNKLRVANDGVFNLRLSDIDIKPDRSKLENLMVKAQVIQILHQIGVDDAEILKTVPMFSDVQHVIAVSKDRMATQFEAANGLLNNGNPPEELPEPTTVNGGMMV